MIRRCVFPLALFYVVCCSGAVAASTTSCSPLLGAWRSDEAKTLANMASVALPEEVRKMFEHDFFGSMVVEFDCSQVRSYYQGQVREADYELVFVSPGESDVIIQAHDRQSPHSSVLTYVMDGNCFSRDIDGLGFSEVFCRLSDQETARFKATLQ